MNKYVIVGVILIVIVLAIVFRTKLQAWAGKAFAAAQPKPSTLPGPGTGSGTAQQPGLDYNKLLKKGVKGPEVTLLQMWLKVTADGDFGPITEAALLEQTGVKQTTLAEYPTLPDLLGTSLNTQTDVLGGSNSGSLLDGIVDQYFGALWSNSNTSLIGSGQNNGVNWIQ